MTLISVAEAAERFEVSRQRVYQWIEEGRLPSAFRIGKGWAIDGDKLRRPEPQKRGRPRKEEG